MEKIKNFCKEHKNEIILAGLLVGVISYKAHITSVRKQAIKISNIVTFNKTIDWFDNNFTGLDLRALWNEWKINNPSKVITIYR